MFFWGVPCREPQAMAHHLTEAGGYGGHRAGLCGRDSTGDRRSAKRRNLPARLGPAAPESDGEIGGTPEQLGLGMSLVAAEGYGTDAVSTVYELVQELGRRLGDTQSLLVAMHGTYVRAVARGDNRAAALISKRASARFTDEGDPTCRLILHRMAGIAAFQAGKFRQARQTSRHCSSLRSGGASLARWPLGSWRPGGGAGLSHAYCLAAWPSRSGPAA